MPPAWGLTRPAPLTVPAVPAAICGPGARPDLALVEEQETGPRAWRGRGGGEGRPGHPSPCPSADADFAPRPIPQHYYFYLASNWQSAGNVHIDMASYEKIYDLKAEHELPERIFLDKGASYRFSIFLSVRGHSFKSEAQSGLWAGPARSPTGGRGDGGGGGGRLGPIRGAGLLWAGR